MSLKKLGLGAALATAFCVSAFSAASASALTANLEGCVHHEGTVTEFANSKCTLVQTGGGWHKESVGITKEVAAANSTTFTLASTIAGVKFKISCTGLSGSGTAEDVGAEVLGSGIGLTFSGCTVPEPAGKLCQVKAGGEENGKIKTNTLKSVATRTAEEPNAYKNVFIPTTGTVFVTIEVNKCTSEALNGAKELTGSATGISPENGMSEEFSEKSGSELKLGGQVATLTGTNEFAVGESFVNLGP